jgi:hypothetical protein
LLLLVAPPTYLSRSSTYPFNEGIPNPLQGYYVVKVMWFAFAEKINKTPPPFGFSSSKKQGCTPLPNHHTIV